MYQKTSLLEYYWLKKPNDTYKMFSRDYIMKLVEEFARLIAAITGLKLEGKPEEALAATDNAYRDFFEIEPAVIKSMSENEILDFLQKEKAYDNERIKMMAELLFEEGMIYIENGDPVSAGNVLEKSRNLIRYLSDNDNTFSFDWYEKLHEIDRVLGL